MRSNPLSLVAAKRHLVNLFVDCDDTLVFYQEAGPNPYGIYWGTPYEVNQRLVQGIVQFRDRDPAALIVVWPGGGVDYAEMVMIRLGLDRVAVPMLKNVLTFQLIKDGDVVVDDDPLLGRRTHEPDEWPEQEQRTKY